MFCITCLYLNKFARKDKYIKVILKRYGNKVTDFNYKSGLHITFSGYNIALQFQISFTQLLLKCDLRTILFKRST